MDRLLETLHSCGLCVPPEKVCECSARSDVTSVAEHFIVVLRLLWVLRVAGYLPNKCIIVMLPMKSCIQTVAGMGDAGYLHCGCLCQSCCQVLNFGYAVMVSPLGCSGVLPAQAPCPW